MPTWQPTSPSYQHTAENPALLKGCYKSQEQPQLHPLQTMKFTLFSDQSKQDLVVKRFVNADWNSSSRAGAYEGPQPQAELSKVIMNQRRWRSMRVVQFNTPDLVSQLTRR